MTFYDRDTELHALKTAFESSSDEFYVIYGRRRVGKTELLKVLCADQPHIYFLAAHEAEHRQREKFVEKIADYFDDRVPRVEGWDETFDYLGEKLATEQLIVVIDRTKYPLNQTRHVPATGPAVRVWLRGGPRFNRSNHLVCISFSVTR
jgi:hypothetical protein